MSLLVSSKRWFFPGSEKCNYHWLQNKTEAACSSGNHVNLFILESKLSFYKWRTLWKARAISAQNDICFYYAVVNETEPFYFMTEHVRDVHAIYFWFQFKYTYMDADT